MVPPASRRFHTARPLWSSSSLTKLFNQDEAYRQAEIARLPSLQVNYNIHIWIPLIAMYCFVWCYAVDEAVDGPY